MIKRFFAIKFHQNFVFDFIFFKRIFLELEKQNNNLVQRQTLNNFFSAYFNAYLNYNHSNFYDAYKFISVTIPGLTTNLNSIKGFLNDYPEGKIFVLIRDPFLWWNSARKHTKRLEKYGLSRYEKSLENTKLACHEYKNNVFALSFDNLVKDTDNSMRKLLRCAGLEFNKISLYPSNFPYYAMDNSTFGPKKTKTILKEKLDRDLDLPEVDQNFIQKNIYPLYQEVLQGHTINFIE